MGKAAMASVNKYKRTVIGTRVVIAALMVNMALGLSGCVATGVRIGPVFIPIDTGKDKKQEKKQEKKDQKQQQKEQQKEQQEEQDQQAQPPQQQLQQD